MKILLTKLSEGIGYQILDAWHAYKQHQRGTDNYVCDIQYQETQQVVESMGVDLSILLLGIDQAEELDNQALSHYDLILFCNGGEPLSVCSPKVKKILAENHHAYIICNSYLTADHEMFKKAIWFPHNIQTCRDYWTRHFYPQYFDNRILEQLPRNRAVEFINGRSSANRQYFVDLLSQAGSNISIKSSLGKQIFELSDCQWESPPDTAFKTYVNSLYNTVWHEHSDYNYYDNSPKIGINNCFGSIPPGYFILPLYFESCCVAFPESGWQNNELNITEKSLKCFYAGSLPFPISGANVNKLYNEVGFRTAWNLLPADLQQFDSETDHVIRYQGMVECLTWLVNNKEIFLDNQAHDMIAANKINFLTCAADYLAVCKFDQVLHAHTRH